MKAAIGQLFLCNSFFGDQQLFLESGDMGDAPFRDIFSWRYSPLHHTTAFLRVLPSDKVSYKHSCNISDWFWVQRHRFGNPAAFIVLPNITFFYLYSSQKHYMEGPALTLLKDEAQAFIGQKITEAWGDSKMDKEPLIGQRLNQLQSWGKHFLMVLDDCTIRIHYLMFGNYYLNSKHPDKEAKLGLAFANGSEWNNYNCAVRILPETDMSKLYDFSSDIMDETWDAGKAKAKLKQHPDMQVCDALMNQDIFSGVGNVIKNEALFRIKVHPQSLVGALPAGKLDAMIEEAHTYSYDFYRWRKEGTLRKKYCVHQRKYCPVCRTVLRKEFTGELNRSSFWCPNCQLLYATTNGAS